MGLKDRALELHSKNPGKIEINPSIEIEDSGDLDLVYTPGVAEPCKKISEDPKRSYDYTSRGNVVGVISDGSAVLGLGDIGPEAAMPVMEGKANLLKKFGEVDGLPLVLDEESTQDFIEHVESLEPSLGAVNLEDISSPECFEIEKKLKEKMDIPVFHDDQHGTAVVVRAALLNALELENKPVEETEVVVIGAGAAGVAVSEILIETGVKNLIPVDSSGIVTQNNEEDYKADLAEKADVESGGSMEKALEDADAVIGLSVGGILSKEHIEMMSEDPIVFALANPDPEILPSEARDAGASIVATGRSDFENQVNNSLAFPGVFRGILDAKANSIGHEEKIAASEAIRNFSKPKKSKIVPETLDRKLARKIAKAVRNTAK